ncbi:baseplate multidomain protein megatron [Rhodalgimonas zhirmunskyi]|uniref:Glycoside hydrolase/phage tail family protein n=1 Tax=Rhodalgimonas zhirmunskyi TaxID=2964767 RepID=A0AAJ1X3X9_9RHOB|nr:glycoside hydrolase/phage tail family protein [Rhodoalgimonas zhirmunskyi]MDQ2092539.1 glycoside hydrolase/phage tail family protein [Rhodoalgimonas zhirmunskyi]
MATVLLSAAGATIGGSIGGTVLGLSSVAIGRLAGATLGRVIDQRIMGQGSEAVESGRVERFRLTGAGEGDPVAQIYGRMQVAGHVIWATQFTETVTTTGGGGKGSPARPETREYSYSLSLAVALCEGEIAGVCRVWADGVELSPDALNMRVYTGASDQLPDPKMEAVEGAGQVPAYRGTAYVVFEDLGLSQFGNRVPQFTFEVIRPSQQGMSDAETDMCHGIKAVAMMPGSGEYTLASTAVRFDFGAGQSQLVNVNTPSGKADFLTSLDRMVTQLSNCGSTSLIVSWFGSDLRCGTCEIRPKVEQKEQDAVEMPWSCAGHNRATAELLPTDADGQPVYGGTPADVAVLEAIAALQDAGQAVMYYPFILMDQMEGNALPDPYDAEAQPKLPWRGRITLSKAPGLTSSPDNTSVADAEVAAFFGTASAADFAISTGGVSYAGPEEWSYRRFILHQAALCAAAGGVSAFCIGSEMRGLTQIRGASGFPAVEALIDLAAECRALLGPEVKIGYAADWSEYFGYNSPDGDRYFHLDPLWADGNIDFIGIDNYMPLSDWRAGREHVDGANWPSIYDLDYLRSNIAGGEGYDWYYHSSEARAAQIRTPITDDAYGEAWIWRYKDILNWWRNQHHERIGGVRQAMPTAWEPESKPIWFTEMGCAAIDKGTNQPNKFLDPKSSESAIPYFSEGHRDEFIQMQYLRAMITYWGDANNNPISEVYQGQMVDMARAHVWAWDARPYPFFPANSSLWGDAENYSKGHWITGRVSARALASVVEEICGRAGLTAIDTSGLHGVVHGYVSDQVSEARASLQGLMLRFGFDAVERDGVLKFIMRDGEPVGTQDVARLAVSEEVDGNIERQRASEADLVGRVRLRFVQLDGSYEVLSEEAVLPDQASHAVASSEIPIALTRGEGRQVVERWLSEARVSRDTARFALPLSRLDLGPGDVVRIEDGARSDLMRIDRLELGTSQIAEAVRIEPEVYRPVEMPEDRVSLSEFIPPVPVFPLFLDLPLITGEEVPHAPHLAVTAAPWPGSAALYASSNDSDYSLNRIIAARSSIGVTTNALFAAAPGLYDKGPGLLVKLTSGTLQSVSELAMLNGANLAAIGDGASGNWELIQFRDAQLVDENTYMLTTRLRGQLGSDAWQPDVWPAGSYFVLLDSVPQQIGLTLAQRNMARDYRIGPAQRGYDDPSYTHLVEAFEGVGLKPLSPCHLTAQEQVDGSVLAQWIRRTRTGGDSWDGMDVPLGEEREAYLVRVRKDGAVLREEEVSVASWSYSGADRLADGAGANFDLEVAQVSAVFGAGAWAGLSYSD